MDQLGCYDYALPAELIAREPLEERDASRMLVLDRQTGTIEHRSIRELANYLRRGDCLVLNDTAVIPARLVGYRVSTGGKWEGLYLETTGSGEWRLLGQTRGRIRPGEQISIRPTSDRDEQTGCSPTGKATRELRLTLLDREEEGIWRARVESDADGLALLREFGTVPLPPYIGRELATEADWQRYQTSYARHPGAVAAPTAGLHFTAELLDDCRSRGIETAFVTLHVGIGTFRPIAVEDLAEHRMHAEWFEMPAETADRLRKTRAGGGRIVAVGTTSVRTLESSVAGGEVRAGCGTTDLFIRPPHRFTAVDGLLTNFHLPRSSLLVLVSAFAGIDAVQRAYAAAIRERYRFYSYGDAMLIV